MLKERKAKSIADDIKMIVGYILKLEKSYTNISFSFNIKKETTDKKTTAKNTAKKIKGGKSR